MQATNVPSLSYIPRAGMTCSQCKTKAGDIKYGGIGLMEGLCNSHRHHMLKGRGTGTKKEAMRADAGGRRVIM